MIILSKSQVLMLYSQLMEVTGGSAGIRDEKMLESALSNPFQSFHGEELYPSIQAKAAQLCFGLVKNHPASVGKDVGFLCEMVRKVKQTEVLPDEILSDHVYYYNRDKNLVEMVQEAG